MTIPLLVRFADGDATMAALLGGKGANLAEMTRLGLPVPPGFTITTEECRQSLITGTTPTALPGLVTEALHDLELQFGRTFGGGTEGPLLVSVRSGARFSMPGMMETVLNVGLSDGNVEGLASRGGDRFAGDCYRRLVQMYGRTVLGVAPERFENRVAQERREAGAHEDGDLDATALRALVEDFRVLSDPFETLDQDGVGQLVLLAAQRGRAARSELELGVCGEHAGDPESIHFFARLEAGRAAVLQDRRGTVPDTR